ncbi:MAG: hypothetical protein Q8K65_11670 [Alphaproteobacteria bacterium]|nr:hypothetical protein [Alphaproteobacteria bacterium]
MADQPKDSFNNSARRKLMAAAAMALGIAGVSQDDVRTQFEVSLFAPNAGPFVNGGPDAQKNTALTEPVQRPLAVEEIWSDHGLSGQKFTDAFAALSAEQKDRIALRSRDLFAQAGFTDVMLHMAEGKQKKLSEILEKIADMPPGMRLMTTDYISITSEQNKIVWQEFQERAEPAFYRHLAATQEAALRESGFCDYAIDCMRRGHGPTNKDGIHYNVDIDHLTERKGGGPMCMEKSVDPALGGAPMYRINHLSNLCLIMRDVHTQTKNAINGLQSINAIPAGETRRIVMAVPEEGKELMMIHAQDLRAGIQPPKETSYFALGPSLLIRNDLQEMEETVTVSTAQEREKFFNDMIRPNLTHTLKLWDAFAASLERAQAAGTLKGRDISDMLVNCNDFLKPLEAAMTRTRMPQEALENLGNISKRIYSYLENGDSGKPQMPKNPEGKKPHVNA